MFPNATDSYNPTLSYQYCGNTTVTGCMYDIYEDPNEYINIASQQPALFAQMHTRMNQYQADVLNPYRGEIDPAACDAAMDVYGGHWGPWLNATNKR